MTNVNTKNILSIFYLPIIILYFLFLSQLWFNIPYVYAIDQGIKKIKFSNDDLCTQFPISYSTINISTNGELELSTSVSFILDSNRPTFCFELTYSSEFTLTNTKLSIDLFASNYTITGSPRLFDYEGFHITNCHCEGATDCDNGWLKGSSEGCSIFSSYGKYCYEVNKAPGRWSYYPKAELIPSFYIFIEFNNTSEVLNLNGLSQKLLIPKNERLSLIQLDVTPINYEIEGIVRDNLLNIDIAADYDIFDPSFNDPYKCGYQGPAGWQYKLYKCHDPLNVEYSSKSDVACLELENRIKDKNKNKNTMFKTRDDYFKGVDFLMMIEYKFSLTIYNPERTYEFDILYYPRDCCIKALHENPFISWVSPTGIPVYNNIGNVCFYDSGNECPTNLKISIYNKDKQFIFVMSHRPNYLTFLCDGNITPNCLLKTYNMTLQISSSTYCILPALWSSIEIQHTNCTSSLKTIQPTFESKLIVNMILKGNVGSIIKIDKIEFEMNGKCENKNAILFIYFDKKYPKEITCSLYHKVVEYLKFEANRTEYNYTILNQQGAVKLTCGVITKDIGILDCNVFRWYQFLTHYYSGYTWEILFYIFYLFLFNIFNFISLFILNIFNDEKYSILLAILNPFNIIINIFFLGLTIMCKPIKVGLDNIIISSTFFGSLYLDLLYDKIELLKENRNQINDKKEIKRSRRSRFIKNNKNKKDEREEINNILPAQNRLTSSDLFKFTYVNTNKTAFNGITYSKPFGLPEYSIDNKDVYIIGNKAIPFKC